MEDPWEEDEIDQIIEKGKEVKLEPKKRRRAKKAASEVIALEEEPKPEEVVYEEPKTQIIEDSKPTPKQEPLTAQDILAKSEDELKQLSPESKRETRNLLRDLKIITAILLGKNKNKELSKVLNTDKSFTSKQIKELEEQGLVKKEGEGRETRYEIDSFNVMKLLQTKVAIKWKKREGKKDGN